jgi:hypothetical protein
VIWYTATAWTPGGGLSSADTFCSTNRPAGLAGTVVALLATTTASAASRLNATANYYRPDGQFLGTGADLQAGGTLWNGIWQNNLGAYQAGVGGFEYTGATAFGNVGTAATTCGNWVDTAGTAAGGRSNTVGTDWWYSYSMFGCNSAGARSLFCVQQ